MSVSVHVERVDHVGIMVADIDRAVAWYVAMLGGEIVDRWANLDADMAWAHLDMAGQRVEFVQRPHLDGRPTSSSGYHHLALTVGDCTAAVDALVSAGAKVVFPPAYFDRHDMDWAFVTDPFGNILELVSYRSSHRP